MKKINITLIALGVLFLVYSFEPTGTKTLVFTSNDSRVIQSQIKVFSAYGYSVKHIVPQSVAVSDGQFGHTRLKGDIIVVMTKLK